MACVLANTSVIHKRENCNWLCKLALMKMAKSPQFTVKVIVYSCPHLTIKSCCRWNVLQPIIWWCWQRSLDEGSRCPGWRLWAYLWCLRHSVQGVIYILFLLTVSYTFIITGTEQKKRSCCVGSKGSNWSRTLQETFTERIVQQYSQPSHCGITCRGFVNQRCWPLLWRYTE